MAAFQSAGSTDGRVELRITGGDELVVVSAFGVVQKMPVKNGHVVLPVPELPVYVELAKGQSLTIVPTTWGPNRALGAGVSAAASGEPGHPADKPGTPKEKRMDNDVAKVFKVFTAVTRTSVDSYYSDRWIFLHHFQPITTSKIRLLVHDATYGGGATKAVGEAGGQTGMHQIMLREIELYGQ